MQTDRLGVTAGGEFAAAAAAANDVGAQLVLGDRPVEITLQRAWDALPWRQRGALLGDLVRGATSPLPSELNAEVRGCVSGVVWLGKVGWSEWVGGLVVAHVLRLEVKGGIHSH